MHIENVVESHKIKIILISFCVASKKLYVQEETENQNQDVSQNELPIIKKNLVWWFDLLAVNSIT